MTKTLEERVQRIEDVIEIAALKARYCDAVDGGWVKPTNDGSAVAALFVEDGVWGYVPDGPTGRGRAGIRDLIDSHNKMHLVLHNVMNPLIELDGDRATGRWHAIWLGKSELGEPFWSAGVYEEEYVRMAQGWRFKSMMVVPVANGPCEHWNKGRARWYPSYEEILAKAAK